MKKYIIYDSTNEVFEGLVIYCNDNIDAQCLNKTINKDFTSSKIIKTIKGYIVQNEHFTLILKEVI